MSNDRKPPLSMRERAQLLGHGKRVVTWMALAYSVCIIIGAVMLPPQTSAMTQFLDGLESNQPELSWVLTLVSAVGLLVLAAFAIWRYRWYSLIGILGAPYGAIFANALSIIGAAYNPAVSVVALWLGMLVSTFIMNWWLEPRIFSRPITHNNQTDS